MCFNTLLNIPVKKGILLRTVSYCMFYCMKFIQPKCMFLFFFSLYLVNVCSSHHSISPTITPRSLQKNYDEFNKDLTIYKLNLDFHSIFTICVLIFGMITLLWLSYLNLYSHVRYVTFTTNLTIESTSLHLKAQYR